jgi:hypothetical protein
LTGQARVDLATIRTVEQIAFVLTHRGHPINEGGVDVDMAGSTGAGTPAQREWLVDAAIPEDLHDAHARLSLKRDLFSGTAGNDYIRHDLS